MEYKHVLLLIIRIMSMVSVCSTLLQVYLMHCIDRWNGFTSLLYSMSLCLFVYNCAFFFYGASKFDFLLIFGGLSVSLWTMVLSTCVWYLAETFCAIRIFKNYNIFILIAVVFPIIVTFIVYINTDRFNNGESYSHLINYLYFAIRLFCLIYLLTSFSRVSYIIKKLDEKLFSLEYIIKNETIDRLEMTENTSENIEIKKKFCDDLRTKTEALRTLNERIKYYPAAQILVRIVVLWIDIYQLTGINLYIIYQFNLIFI